MTDEFDKILAHASDPGDSDTREAHSRADPLVQQAEHYATTVVPIARGLRPVVVRRGDPEIIEAVDTIASLCMKVATKVYRAVHDATDPDQDTDDVQCAANGSAKAARLIIADSRRAWIALMAAGRATANGVPAKLVETLDALDASLASRFPRAMEFVRPP